MKLLQLTTVGLLRSLFWLVMGIARVVKLTPRTMYYPLGRFVFAYCGVAVAVLAAFATYAGIGFVAYFLAGYALNRYVLVHLEWNSFEFSLGDIARVKVLALLAWPIMYPPFFVQLAIARFL